MAEPVHTIFLAIGTPPGVLPVEVYDSLRIPMVPTEALENDVPTAGQVYNHLADVLLKLGQWFDAARIVYVLCHSLYGYRRRSSEGQG